MEPEIGDNSPKPSRAELASSGGQHNPPPPQPPTKRRRKVPTTRIGVSLKPSLLSAAQHLLRWLPSPWHGDFRFPLGPVEAKSWHRETPLCSWHWPLGCGMFPLLSPAAFNGIWVKHQFMDYGWVEKAPCPSLEYKQIKRPKSTKKNECPYSQKRQSHLEDEERPLSL